LRRGRPYGASTWMKETAQRLGIESSLRPRGRPRKGKEMNEEDMPSLFSAAGEK